MSVEAPLHHEEVVRGLWRAARADRLPHALLFQGPGGVGKYRSAFWFTLGLFCAGGVPDDGAGPCGVCPPCKRVLAGSHPDLFIVAPEPGEEHLGLKRFVTREGGPRSVQDFLGLRAAEGGRRVILVREMERTRDSQNAVQNALLKMLEEPGQDVIWVLETSRIESMLDTIKSRCVPVRFERLEPAETASILAAKGIEPGTADELARWSRGSPGGALDLAAAGAQGIVRLLWSVLEGAPPVATARSMWALEGEFPGKTPRAQQRTRARVVLGLTLDLLADQLRLAAGAAPETLAHPGPTPSEPGGQLAGEPWATEVELRRTLDGVLEARRDIDRNLDPQAVLDAAFAALGDLQRPVTGART